METRCLRPTLIYALLDPETGEPRYVGKTTKTLLKRLCAHEEEARNLRGSSRRVLNWLRSLRQRGLRARIVELQIVPPGKEWARAESKWIRRLGQRHALVNATRGGEGVSGWRHSEEFKRLARRRGKRRWRNPTYRAHMLQVRQSMNYTPEWRAKISRQAKERWRARRDEMIAKSNAGKDAAWCARMAEKIKAAWRDPDKRAAMMANRR